MDYDPKKQRIWIELETPVVIDPKAKALTNSQKAARDNYNAVASVAEQKELMEKRAAMASQMLRRCGVEGEDRIFVYEDKGLPYYANSQAGGMFSVMPEGGVWMNLGYLGRDGD